MLLVAALGLIVTWLSKFEPVRETQVKETRR
jgi:hypothetical protein